MLYFDMSTTLLVGIEALFAKLTFDRFAEVYTGCFHTLNVTTAPGNVIPIGGA